MLVNFIAAKFIGPVRWLLASTPWRCASLYPERRAPLNHRHYRHVCRRFLLALRCRRRRDGWVAAILVARAFQRACSVCDRAADFLNVGPSNGDKYYGGVLLPDGRVVLVPANAATIGLYDPATNTMTAGPNVDTSLDIYYGGVLLPDGRVVLVPEIAATIGLYEPGESLPPAYTLSKSLPTSWNALLLPYYNKL